MSCVQTGVRRAVVCIQKGEATGNVEVSKASVVTWAPRGTERQSSGAGHEGRREPRLGNEDGVMTCWRPRIPEHSLLLAAHLL